MASFLGWVRVWDRVRVIGYDSGYWLVLGFGLGLGFGSEIRARGLEKGCHVTAHWRVI